MSQETCRRNSKAEVVEEVVSVTNSGHRKKIFENTIKIFEKKFLSMDKPNATARILRSPDYFINLIFFFFKGYVKLVMENQRSKF